MRIPPPRPHSPWNKPFRRSERIRSPSDMPRGTAQTVFVRIIQIDSNHYIALHPISQPSCGVSAWLWVRVHRISLNSHNMATSVHVLCCVSVTSCISNQFFVCQCMSLIYVSAHLPHDPYWNSRFGPPDTTFGAVRIRFRLPPSSCIQIAAPGSLRYS